MKKHFKLACLFSYMLILLITCKPITPSPKASITAKIVNNVVTFSLTTTNSSAYKWRFGDGDSMIVYSSAPVVHAYDTDGKTYPVSLVVLGPGGQSTAQTSVEIPTMSQIDMLTGGAEVTKGKAWRISSSYGIQVTSPDSAMTILRNYPAGVLTTLGLDGAYTDKYFFFSNGNYTVSPVAGGALSGISFCTFNNLVNVQPQAADSVGLTYAIPYKSPSGLTFTYNQGKDLTISTTPDGISSTDIIYTDVNTLSFSANGFFGLRDFMKECIVQQMAPTRMTVAFFVSDTLPQAPQIGKITKIWILTFEAVL